MGISVWAEHPLHPCHQREEGARERETKLVISSLGYPKMIAAQSFGQDLGTHLLTAADSVKGDKQREGMQTGELISLFIKCWCLEEQFLQLPLDGRGTCEGEERIRKVSS